MNFAAAVVAVVAAAAVAVVVAAAVDEVVWHPFGPAMYSMLTYL